MLVTASIYCSWRLPPASHCNHLQARAKKSNKPLIALLDQMHGCCCSSICHLQAVIGATSFCCAYKTEILLHQLSIIYNLQAGHKVLESCYCSTIRPCTTTEGSKRSKKQRICTLNNTIRGNVAIPKIDEMIIPAIPLIDSSPNTRKTVCTVHRLPRKHV